MTGHLCAVAREFPSHPIINGHRLQPNNRELRAIGHPDITASEAEEVDRLYQMLTRCSSSGCVTQSMGEHSAEPEHRQLTLSDHIPDPPDPSRQSVDEIYRELMSQPPYICPGVRSDKGEQAC
jgi:hypothetical protein